MRHIPQLDIFCLSAAGIVSIRTPSFRFSLILRYTQLSISINSTRVSINWSSKFRISILVLVCTLRIKNLLEFSSYFPRYLSVNFRPFPEHFCSAFCTALMEKLCLNVDFLLSSRTAKKFYWRCVHLSPFQ